MVVNVLEVYSFDELYESSWGGARYTLDDIINNDKVDEFKDLLNEILSSYENGMDRTALNDFIWFDREYIYNELEIPYE